jgi:hypothetical protein
MSINFFILIGKKYYFFIYPNTHTHTNICFDVKIVFNDNGIFFRDREREREGGGNM